MPLHLTIPKKGLILLSIPLLFQLAFIGLLVWMEKAEDQADAWVDRTREIVLQTHQVVEELLNGQTGSRGFVLTADASFLTPYESSVRSVPEALDRLEALVMDPDQKRRVAEIAAKAVEFQAWHAETIRLVRVGETDRAVARVQTAGGNRQMDALRELTGTFLREEARLEEARALVLERIRQWYSWLLILGTVGSLSITLMIGYVFQRGIVRRLASLSDNAQRLARGQDLAPPIAGGDEITAVDRAFRDMTVQLASVREALESQTRLLQSVMDNMGDGVVVADATGKFLMFNPAAERILGVGLTPTAPQEWATTYGTFLPDGVTQFPAQELPLTRAIRGEVCDQVEMFIRNAKVPQGVWIEVSGRPIRDGKATLQGGVVVLRDVSERKQVQEKIRKLNDDLERRVQQRTAELAEANRDLVEKNHENEMFVYTVSHDLRSPLVNLEGFGKELSLLCQEIRAILLDSSLPPTLQQRGLALLDGDMAESIRFIQNGVMRLSKIIDALLRLSRAGRIEFEAQHVELQPVVERIVASMAGTISDRRAKVTIGTLAAVRGDATAVEQIFANLIGNALNYRDPERPGRIEVGSVSPGPANGSGRHEALRTFYVKDNGLGIPAAYHPKLFKAFQRVHPGVAEGEGMGLTIVNRIVQRLRGRIWFESKEGEGSTFFVSLPAPQTPTSSVGLPTEDQRTPIKIGEEPYGP
jgi:signal transduction histidine kinase